MRRLHELFQVLVRSGDTVSFIVRPHDTWNQEHVLDVHDYLIETSPLLDAVVFQHLRDFRQVLHFGVDAADFAIPHLQRALHRSDLVAELQDLILGENHLVLGISLVSIDSVR